MSIVTFALGRTDKPQRHRQTYRRQTDATL